MEELLFARIREDAVIPSKRVEDAGYDIYAAFDEDYMLFAPLETRRVPTGLLSAFSRTITFSCRSAAPPAPAASPSGAA